jgi:acetoin utilization protein AcuC
VKRGLDKRASITDPRVAAEEELERFHTPKHVAWVKQKSEEGYGSIDYGDTPACPGIYEAAATVAGSALHGLDTIMSGYALRTFQPIGGLHHARPEGAAGFCVFNDIGVVIDTLREQHGVRRIAYVDIDVHHGDGLFYPYEEDAELIFADIHQDGRTLYPGTGHVEETGKGAAKGTKLNIPLLPGMGDKEFLKAWEFVEAHVRAHKPEFVLFQCGADSIAGDPLAMLQYSPAAHAHAAKRLCVLANELTGGRIMGFGGGGYNRANLAAGWCGVLEEFLKA